MQKNRAGGPVGGHKIWIHSAFQRAVRLPVENQTDLKPDGLKQKNRLLAAREIAMIELDSDANRGLGGEGLQRDFKRLSSAQLQDYVIEDRAQTPAGAGAAKNIAVDDLGEICGRRDPARAGGKFCQDGPV